jgi:DNA-binding CsgD family transcriptional regulator
MPLNASTYEQYLDLISGPSSIRMQQEADLIVNRFQQRRKIVSRFAPVTFVVDFATKKYMYVEEACFDLLGFTSNYLIETSLKTYLDKFHPAYYEITNTNVFSDNLTFLKSITTDQYADHVFSYNYKIMNAAGNYINVLQRFSFVPGKKTGEPSGMIGVIFDITHFKNDNTIVHTIEKTSRYDDELINTLVYKKVHPVYEVASLQLMSKRELEILKLMAEGFGSKQIAHKLHLSINTINNHRKNMLQKANCNTSAELLNRAVKHGLV